jgi:hypothetical protein
MSEIELEMKKRLSSLEAAIDEMQSGLNKLRAREDAATRPLRDKGIYPDEDKSIPVAELKTLRGEIDALFTKMNGACQERRNILNGLSRLVVEHSYKSMGKATA